MSLTFRELGENHRVLLIGLYQQASVPLDNLPYSTEFEQMYEAFVSQTNLPINRTNVWKSLSTLRKTKRLQRKIRKIGHEPER
jgi:hypothetical protein